MYSLLCVFTSKYSNTVDFISRGDAEMGTKKGAVPKWGPKRGLSQNGDRIPSRAPLSPLRAVTAPIYVQLAEQVAAKGFKW